MLLQGYNAHFAMPDVLVDDSIKADSPLNVVACNHSKFDSILIQDMKLKLSKKEFLNLN